jgi:hypothetical protein
MYTYGSHVFGSVNFSGVEGRKERKMRVSGVVWWLRRWEREGICVE